MSDNNPKLQIYKLVLYLAKTEDKTDVTDRITQLSSKKQHFNDIKTLS